jgi:hypothetical protein
MVRSHRLTRHRTAWLAAALSLAVIACGCGPKKPSRLELDPAEGMKFHAKGKTASIVVGAYDERDKPFIRQPKLEWSSSDDTVATVDQTGKVTSTGSGVAKITASMEGVSASTEVRVIIVDKIEFSKEMVSEHKANPELRLPIKVIVKDDKGNPIEKPPRITYEATSGCIDVYKAGEFVAYQKGECSIIAKCAGKEASFRIKVK